MVVVEVLPLLELHVEQVGVVDHDPVEHLVELLLSMRCDLSTLPLSLGVSGRM